MSSSIPDHRSVIASLSANERSSLRQKSDFAGLTHLIGHLGLIAIGSIWILNAWPGWQLVMLPQGICLIFLFTLLHECVHDTPFASSWINRLLAFVCGFIIVLPPTWFKYFHLAHHRYTHDKERDPELAEKKPENWQQYLTYLSGFPTWIVAIKTLIKLCKRLTRASFVPPKARIKVRREARGFVAIYVAVIVTSALTQNPALLWIWGIPIILGQPFLRAYLLAEHTFCPHVANMLENTRTTYTGRLVRFITWNMPYHTEHHTYPVVPFHKLPDLHRHMRKNLQQTENGYSAFHGKYAKRL